MGRVLAVVVVVVLAVAYLVVQLVRPDPPVAAQASQVSVTMPGAGAPITWPAQGEAAVGVEGSGLLGTHGTQTATPLASVTKLMTAYVILRDHPLSGSGTGPNLTVTPADVALYQTEQTQGDSVVPVVAGEQLSERQALEGLLIPSGDNIARLLATWDAGSTSAFVAKMNADAKALGLTNTHYTDPSGVVAGSESTAASQARLAMVDMTIPAFRTIVGMAQVTLPNAGVQYNVDSQLGTDGIVGIKTGWTPTAGGCFVFAATTKINGRTQTVVGAVLQQVGTTTQPSALTQAFIASRALITSADRAIEQQTVIRRGQTVGRLTAPWAQPVSLQASRSVTLTGLPGQHVSTSVVLPGQVKAPLAAHYPLGSLVVRLGDERVTVPLETSRALPGASLTWRLTNV